MSVVGCLNYSQCVELGFAGYSLSKPINLRECEAETR
jgi:hypothetical protein